MSGYESMPGLEYWRSYFRYEIQTCLICFALVSDEYETEHTEWHKRQASE